MPSARARRVLGSIGANIRRLRLQRGLTQQKLAEAADLDDRFFQRVERGETNIGVVALVSLAEALNTEPELLFADAKVPPPVKGRPRKVKSE